MYQYACMCAQLLQSYPTLCDPWTIARQAPQSMEFSSQEYWSELPFPPPGDLSDPGIKPWSPALQADSLLSEPPGKSLDKTVCVWGWWESGVCAGMCFPGGATGKESTCQCRRCRFPGLGRYPRGGKWQHTPVFLPEKSYGQKILAGYSLRDPKESDMTDAYTHTFNFKNLCLAK